MTPADFFDTLSSFVWLMVAVVVLFFVMKVTGFWPKPKSEEQAALIPIIPANVVYNTYRNNGEYKLVQVTLAPDKVMETIHREMDRVNSEGRSVQAMFLGSEAWSTFCSDSDVAAFFDPNHKHEQLLVGHMGMILTIDVFSDSFFDPMTGRFLEPASLTLISGPF